MKNQFKPGLYSGVFATSGKHCNNFAVAFVVAAWVEDVGGFGMSKSPASDIDAEESEKLLNLLALRRRRRSLLSNQLVCLRSHDVPLLLGTFHESVW